MAQLDNLTVTGKTVVTGDLYTEGQILTSFSGPYDWSMLSKNQQVANGSRVSAATTVPDLVFDVRYSSGCMGSFNLTTVYTLNSVALSTGWYNYIWIPHRTGGLNGQPAGDNCNYGSLILCGMTLDAFAVIRFANGNIQSMHKWY